jgi:hypothetical protein
MIDLPKMLNISNAKPQVTRHPFPGPIILKTSEKHGTITKIKFKPQIKKCFRAYY